MVGARVAVDDPGPDSIARLHADIDRATRRLRTVHGARLKCREGCSSCCIDDLTVFDVEAAQVRRHHADLLATGAPHAVGACAFLDESGACRIYAERPQVCRTQGLPLRWTETEAEDDAAVELRAICPLNEAGEPIVQLRADACWTLGPAEERLALLQLAAGAGAPRTRLRDLFVTASAPPRSETVPAVAT
jgi:Fe-S-cluster containining protein